jgi:hypothetical protein
MISEMQSMNILMKILLRKDRESYCPRALVFLLLWMVMWRYKVITEDVKICHVFIVWLFKVDFDRLKSIWYSFEKSDEFWID